MANYQKVDRFTKWLNLSQPYYEQSMVKVVDYEVTRAGWNMLAMLGVGLLSGFLGLGGGSGTKCYHGSPS